jgi:hypothetical protein
MKTFTNFVVLASALLLAACGGPSTQAATQQFCQDLAQVGTSLATLNNIGPDSTVGEVKEARKEVDQAFEQAAASGAQLRDVKLDTVKTAWDALGQTIDDMPDDATLAEAGDAIKQSAAGVQAAYDQLNTVVCITP